jgi:CHAD domain-containing protein
LDARELDRRIQKLRKSLNGFPKDPTVDDVHDLRTRTRRVESILDALSMTSGNEQKVLANLKLLRKRSGKVRDMDVLTQDVIGVGLKDDPECVVCLTHHLGVQRYRHAGKLKAEADRQSDELRRRLKRTRRKLDATVERFSATRFDLDRKNGDDADERPLHAMSEALRLSTELAAIPHLGRDNLHPYRIEVKRLRYILEMAGDEDGQQKTFIEELKRVQDLIGEWHDWVALSAIARDVLKKHDGCRLVKKIQDTSERKFGEALRATEEMRRRYLPSSQGNKSSRRGKQKRPPLPGPVLVAASKIAA